MDPITTPLLVAALGQAAGKVIEGVCIDHLKGKLSPHLKCLEKLGQRDQLEPAYQKAMVQAYEVCLEMMLLNIKGYGYSDEELKEYGSSIETFIKDDEVAEDLLRSIREPGRDDLPSPDLFRERWVAIDGRELPSDGIWNAVAMPFTHPSRTSKLNPPKLFWITTCETS